MFTPQLWLALGVAPFAGSLLGVLIRRLPTGRPVAVARSACETCFHTLGPMELIPLVSHALQRGRCRWCRAPIAPFHYRIEVASMLVPLSLALVGVRDPSALAAGCLLGWALLALGWIDAEHFLLPDMLTLPLLLAGLAICAWQAPASLTDHAAAAAIGYLSLRAVALAYWQLRGRDGLGQGDAKLFAAAGAWLGVAGLAPTLLAGALLGLVMAVVAATRRRLTLTTRLAFGAPLAAATWAVFLWQSAG